jgi:post-segregation antitoxin (ccd killing protein)
MPKVSIYLPDALYDAVRKHKIPVSTVTQHALEDAVRHRANAEWTARVRSRAARVHRKIDTSALLDEIRSEFGA